MWGKLLIVRRDAEGSGVLRRGAARRMIRLGTVHIAAAPLLEESDFTEYAMQQSGATSHIIDQTCLSRKHVSLALLDDQTAHE